MTVEQQMARQQEMLRRMSPEQLAQIQQMQREMWRRLTSAVKTFGLWVGISGSLWLVGRFINGEGGSRGNKRWDRFDGNGRR